MPRRMRNMSQPFQQVPAFDARREKLKPGIVLVMLAAMLWGTVTVGVKVLYGLGDISPLTVSWLRLTAAGLVSPSAPCRRLFLLPLTTGNIKEAVKEAHQFGQHTLAFYGTLASGRKA
ncbi:MAG: EamA family transporter [Anaerolineae bacterium]